MKDKADTWESITLPSHEKNLLKSQQRDYIYQILI